MLSSRAILLLSLAASVLTGLGHIALLPPFEGFDETALYSYIQQLAETGRWPTRGDKLSQDVVRYLEVAPTTENMHGRWSYPKFFAAGPEVREAGRAAIHSSPASPRAWIPGHENNWQAQH